MLKGMSGFNDEFGVVLAIADEIGLTPSEKTQLRTAIEKAREKYYAEVVKLKEKAHSEIRKAIPAGKRAKVKEVLGDIYDQLQTKRTSRDAAKKGK